MLHRRRSAPLKAAKASTTSSMTSRFHVVSGFPPTAPLLGRLHHGVCLDGWSPSLPAASPPRLYRRAAEQRMLRRNAKWAGHQVARPGEPAFSRTERRSRGGHPHEFPSVAGSIGRRMGLDPPGHSRVTHSRKHAVTAGRLRTQRRRALSSGGPSRTRRTREDTPLRRFGTVRPRVQIPRPRPLFN